MNFNKYSKAIIMFLFALIYNWGQAQNTVHTDNLNEDIKNASLAVLQKSRLFYQKYTQGAFRFKTMLTYLMDDDTTNLEGNCYFSKKTYLSDSIIAFVLDVKFGYFFFNGNQYFYKHYKSGNVQNWAVHDTSGLFMGNEIYFVLYPPVFFTNKFFKKFKQHQTDVQFHIDKNKNNIEITATWQSAIYLGIDSFKTIETSEYRIVFDSLYRITSIKESIVWDKYLAMENVDQTIEYKIDYLEASSSEVENYIAFHQVPKQALQADSLKLAKNYKKPELVDSVPYWSLDKANGQIINDTLLNKDFVVLDFWYRGCFPCMLALPKMKKLAAKYTDNNIQFIGINIFDDAEEVKEIVKEFVLPYPQGIQGRNFAKSLGVSVYPTIIIYNIHTRKVVYAKAGFNQKEINTILEILKHKTKTVIQKQDNQK